MLTDNDRDKNREEKGRSESVRADSKNAVILLLYAIILCENSRFGQTAETLSVDYCTKYKLRNYAVNE